MSSDILVIEAIGRLPGPLATSLLLNRGYDVLKIESDLSRDPFSRQIGNKTGVFFNVWYEELKKGKKFFHFTTKEQSHQLHKKLLPQILNYKRIVILSALKKCPYTHEIEEIINAVTSEGINYKHIKVWSDSKDTPLHDIDLSAQVGILNSESTKPLKYPVCGMMFSQQIALKIATAKYDNKTEVIYFKDEVERVFKPLLQDETPSPIQGEISAYNTYKIKDGMITLSALEKRSWANFTRKLQLELGPESRFSSKSSDSHQELRGFLKNIDKKKLEQLFPEGKERCFSFIN